MCCLLLSPKVPTLSLLLLIVSSKAMEDIDSIIFVLYVCCAVQCASIIEFRLSQRKRYNLICLTARRLLNTGMVRVREELCASEPMGLLFA